MEPDIREQDGAPVAPSRLVITDTFLAPRTVINKNQTIFRIPSHNADKETFFPRSVAIGPLCRGAPHLEGMEKQKNDSMIDLKNKCSCPNLLVMLFTKVYHEMEGRARQCYDEISDITRADFTRILILDSFFIIWFLISLSHEIKESLISLERDIKVIRSDLLLLQNQIPLFVVEEMYHIIQSVYTEIKLPQNFDDILAPFICMDISWGSPFPRDTKGRHLLDLYWLCFLPDTNGQARCLSSSSNPNETNQTEITVSPTVTQQSRASPCNQPPQSETTVPIYEPSWAELTILSNMTTNIPSATELYQVAGVTFEKSPYSKEYFEVTFRKGVMEMPCLKIDPSRRIILKNLIGHEKVQHPRKRKVSSYMLLMDSLINTEKDVELLQECGIIQNGLITNLAAAVFFNELGDTCTVDYRSHPFIELFKDVNKYYGSKCNRRLASLKHNYFSNPWAKYSVCAAGFLLILAVVQTILGGIQTQYTLHPRN